MSERLMAERDWRERERSHRDRARRIVDPHSDRARRGEPHPVWDFLFTYYSLRPGQLRRWHPGYGVVLVGDGALAYLRRSGYGAHPAGVAVTRDTLLARADTVRFIAGLLRAIAARHARLNCFGMHEWAMVYRSQSVRHEQVPLRLGTTATDDVVESMPLRCSHFDAYRFFTAPAAPRNAYRLSREGQAAAEQPGCVHTNMDLYKWCYKLGPLVDSELLLDCLELAAEARELDMRASPYDLRGYGFAAIAIEEPAGRVEYVRAQQHIARRPEPLRRALADRCDLLLDAATGD